jgi:RNA polymerase sigma-70 factor, ECF subfamily
MNSLSPQKEITPSDSPTDTSVPLGHLVEQLRLKTGSDFQDLAKTLVSKVAPLGYKLAFTKLQDRGRAEDALQDAFEIVFSKLSQLRNPAAFRAWFCRIVLHCCNRHTTPELPSPTLYKASSPAPSPVERLGLAQMLRLLPAHDRNVLILREVMNLPYEEIAEVLRIPLGTVRSRLFKARKRALELLKEQRYE